MSMMDNVFIHIHGNTFRMLRKEAIDFFTKCSDYCVDLIDKALYSNLIFALESGSDWWVDDTY